MTSLAANPTVGGRAVGTQETSLAESLFVGSACGVIGDSAFPFCCITCAQELGSAKLNINKIDPKSFGDVVGDDLGRARIESKQNNSECWNRPDRSILGASEQETVGVVSLSLCDRPPSTLTALDTSLAESPKVGGIGGAVDNKSDCRTCLDRFIIGGSEQATVLAKSPIVGSARGAVGDSASFLCCTTCFQEIGSTKTNINKIDPPGRAWIESKQVGNNSSSIHDSCHQLLKTTPSVDPSTTPSTIANDSEYPAAVTECLNCSGPTGSKQPQSGLSSSEGSCHWKLVATQSIGWLATLWATANDNKASAKQSALEVSGQELSLLVTTLPRRPLPVELPAFGDSHQIKLT